MNNAQLPDDMVSFKLPTGNFGFSATKIDTLGASEFTLVHPVVDASGSVSNFRDDLEKAIQESVKACFLSPKSDNLLYRLTTFNDTLNEVHGFKPQATVNIGQYSNFLQVGGSTALFDATVNAVESCVSYSKTLYASDYKVNAIIIVITDGDDNRSTATANSVKNALQTAVNSESLDSILSILVGVNITDAYMQQKLDQFHKDAGFTTFIPLADASKNTLAKLAKFISKSVSSQSKSLGSGTTAPVASLVI